MPTLYVVHENPAWLEPIEIAFKNRGWKVEQLFMTHPYSLCINDLPNQNCVYFNQCSASAGSRGHNVSIQIMSNFLSSLELKNIPVINGSNSLQVEISKWRQYNALNDCNIPTPKTEIFTWPLSDHKNIKLTYINKRLPFILKHNRSGKGLGVIKFNAFDEFETFLSDKNLMKTYPPPSDGIVLFQQYIQSHKPQILRMEFIGRQLVYAFYSDTSYGFELCPADACQIDNGKVNKQSLFKLLDKTQIEKDSKLKDLIGKYKVFMDKNKIDVVGFESIKCHQTNQWITYDVNVCTHYSPSIEKQSGICALDILVDYACNKLKKKQIESKM